MNFWLLYLLLLCIFNLKAGMSLFLLKKWLTFQSYIRSNPLEL